MILLSDLEKRFEEFKSVYPYGTSTTLLDVKLGSYEQVAFGNYLIEGMLPKTNLNKVTT